MRNSFTFHRAAIVTILILFIAVATLVLQRQKKQQSARYIRKLQRVTASLPNNIASNIYFPTIPECSRLRVGILARDEAELAMITDRIRQEFGEETDDLDLCAYVMPAPDPKRRIFDSKRIFDDMESLHTKMPMPHIRMREPK